MKLLRSFLFLLICFASSNLLAQNFPVIRPQLKGDWVFRGDETPEINLVIVNQQAQDLRTKISIKITTDDHQAVYQFAQTQHLSAKDSCISTLGFSVPAPGFYRCIVQQEMNGTKGELQRFNFAYRPEEIVSPVDNQADLRAFWDQALSELASVKPNYKIKLLKDKSSKSKNLYHISMQSLGNETIEAYWAVPTAKGKHMAVITYMGYGSKPWLPSAEGTDYCQLVVSTRGQGLCEPRNIYGDWITSGLGSKETYYYRGAFMDLVRAIDFVCTQNVVDTTKIVVEGGSQGGAFTLAACALDKRVSGGVPTIPFLTDYPDYFKIVHWPAEKINTYIKNNTDQQSSEDVYRTLSYFDIKNLAPWITCPILMGVGLQDEVCPPHTNFASYNLIKSPKEVHVYPHHGHDTPSEFWKLREAFITR